MLLDERDNDSWRLYTMEGNGAFARMDYRRAEFFYKSALTMAKKQALRLPLKEPHRTISSVLISHMNLADTYCEMKANSAAVCIYQQGFEQIQAWYDAYEERCDLIETIRQHHRRYLNEWMFLSKSLHTTESPEQSISLQVP